MASLSAQSQLVQLTKSLNRAEFRGSDGKVRHKCFLSYHAGDADEVLNFVNAFDSVFIPRAVGVSEDSPWIDSTDVGYVMDKIRDDYLADSTVTIVLVGRCTWSRKFIDWEVYSSLRKDRVNRLNGLLAIQLPSGVSPAATMPARVSDNVIRDKDQNNLGYARYNVYPSSATSLQTLIEDAFQARTTRESLIKNARERKTNNSACG